MTNTSGVSKYQHTEYNRYQRVAQRISSIYSDVSIFHMTFSEYLDCKSAVFNSPDYKRLTEYYRGKVTGLDDCLFHSLYEFRFGNPAPLMFAHIGPDMHLFVDGDDSWLSESHEYKANMVCIHIWRQPWMKDRTFRPF